MVGAISIVKRLTAIIASGVALAATPAARAWDTPRPLGPDRPTPDTPQPASSPDQPDTERVDPSPVALAALESIVLASGFALAVFAAVATWLLQGTDSSPAPENPNTSVASPPPAAMASGQLAVCPNEPVAEAASDKDGHFPLQRNVEGLRAADVTSFIVIGNESAAAGRPRDAEAAFLMACRVADQLGGANSVELADAKSHLGAHYVKLALGSGVASGADRAELLRRA